MQNLIINPGGAVNGTIIVPGDKSITHRALIISALQKRAKRVILRNWLQSLDCLATLQILQAMGVSSNIVDEALHLTSVGLDGLEDPGQVLQVGNSGTTLRLMTGVLCGQKFATQITGDASICKRPMDRIIIPLTQMGAQILAVDNQYAPLHIFGGRKLKPINYNAPIASAQVKSAILLADLYAGGGSSVTTPSVCRDHTEIMMRYFAENANKSEVCIDVPGDISSAAFFIVAATIAKQAEIRLCNIGINNTRNAILYILREMGADITCTNIRVINGETRADIFVRSVPHLQAITVPPTLIANAIDDLPILCLAAACAKGTTTISGASELRYKESDRIKMLADGLQELGIKVRVFADGLSITGGQINGGTIRSGGDHRIAMTFALAGLVAQKQIMVQDTANINTSFPNFIQVAQKAGLLIGEIQYANA